MTIVIAEGSFQWCKRVLNHLRANKLWPTEYPKPYMIGGHRNDETSAVVCDLDRQHEKLTDSELGKRAIDMCRFGFDATLEAH